MPFVTDKPLDEYIHMEALDVFCRTLADDVGDELQANVQAGTPVSHRIGKAAQHRPPGTARASVQREPVKREADGWSVRVFSDDSVFPDIEYPTRPHNIPNAFGFGYDFGLHGRFGGKFHPGTHGQYPFARGTAKTDAELDRIAREPLRRFEREVIG